MEIIGWRMSKGGMEGGGTVGTTRDRDAKKKKKTDAENDLYPRTTDLDLAKENAVGHELDLCRRAHVGVVPHLVRHLRPNVDIEFLNRGVGGGATVID